MKLKLILSLVFMSLTGVACSSKVIAQERLPATPGQVDNSTFSKTEGDAFYVVETGDVVISRQAAKDLYTDLDVQERVTMAGTLSQTREKKASQVVCQKSFARAGSNDPWEETSEASCRIRISVKDIGPRE